METPCNVITYIISCRNFIRRLAMLYTQEQPSKASKVTQTYEIIIQFVDGTFRATVIDSIKQRECNINLKCTSVNCICANTSRAGCFLTPATIAGQTCLGLNMTMCPHTSKHINQLILSINQLNSAQEQILLTHAELQQLYVEG